MQRSRAEQEAPKRTAADKPRKQLLLSRVRTLTIDRRHRLDTWARGCPRVRPSLLISARRRRLKPAASRRELRPEGAKLIGLSEGSLRSRLAPSGVLCLRVDELLGNRPRGVAAAGGELLRLGVERRLERALGLLLAQPLRLRARVHGAGAAVGQERVSWAFRCGRAQCARDEVLSEEKRGVERSEQRRPAETASRGSQQGQPPRAEDGNRGLAPPSPLTLKSVSARNSLAKVWVSGRSALATSGGSDGRAETRTLPSTTPSLAPSS